MCTGGYDLRVGDCGRHCRGREGGPQQQSRSGVAGGPNLCPAWGLPVVITRKCLVLGDWIDSHVRHVDLVPVVAQLVQVVHAMASECALANQLRR